MRRLLAFLAVAALAGCAQPAPEPTLPAPPQAPDAATEIPWSLTDCLHAVWFATVPAAPLQARVPDGFAVDADPAGMADLGFEAFECRSGHGLDGEREPMQYGSLFVGVDPPDAFGCDGLPGGCYVKLDVLVPDADRRAWLAGAGVAARNGTASVDVDAAGTYTASLVLEGVGGFGMQGVTPRPPQQGPPGPAPFMEFMAADGGLSVWRANLTGAAQALGAGAWSADPGTWVQQEFGVAGAATFAAGTWSFEGGSVSRPAPPA